jgi:undecaprenyl-diphosphatase
MSLFATPASWDANACRRFNRVNRLRPLGRFFAMASRLGDGVFWYTLMLMLPVFDGWSGAMVAGRMLLTGGMGTVIYLLLKNQIQRSRPCDTFELHRTVEPLDQFSFPSGHTLHACSFTLMAGAAYPALLPVLIVFTAMVACSRLVLGLHYPTDVIWGAGIGSLLAMLSNQIASGSIY